MIARTEDSGQDRDDDVPAIAAAIGDAARARMLYGLADGRARTSTELAALADVSASTASVHLKRLEERRLVKVMPQGKHRYYSLAGREVAAALEALSVLAGGTQKAFAPKTPHRLRAARTCYDHIAGTLGVALHDRLIALRYIATGTQRGADYELTTGGTAALTALNVDVAAAREARRRLAFPCLDWSERRPHLGGALASALLQTALRRKWVVQDLDSRALSVTPAGHREMARHFGVARV